MTTQRFSLLLILATSLTSLLPFDAYGNGFIIIDPGQFETIFIPERKRLDLTHHQVAVLITDDNTVIKIDQVFRNPYSNNTACTYTFPIPEGLKIDTFSIKVNQNTIPVQTFDAKQADRIYENLACSAFEATLLKYQGMGMFQVQIPPQSSLTNGQINISIEYSQRLTGDNGIIKYHYPMNLNNISGNPVEEVSIAVEFDSSYPMADIYSSTHTTDVQQLNQYRVHALYEEKNVSSNHDFILYCTLPHLYRDFFQRIRDRIFYKIFGGLF